MSDWNPRAVEIFLAVLDLATTRDKQSLIDERCGDDRDLRREVESLLVASEAAGDFLEQPLVPPLPTLVDREIDLDFLEASNSPECLGRLGEYEVTDVIGRGGMGIVLQGRDPRLNRVVAIKALAPELSGNASARKRFLREAQSAAAVTHQQVVTIHAVSEAKVPYLVMEYVAGQSLQEKIEREGTLPLKEVLRIGSQIAAGLAAAHAQGLIHRDIKPANILLENGIERVRITDFGLARAVDDAEITRTGEVTGTPQFMSPEQAQGDPVDARSDLFSLGCVMYAMCTGRSPFRAETTVATIRRVCDNAPRPIREINSEIPDWLANLIDRLLEKDPDKRIQTAFETAALLEQCLAHTQNPRSTPLPVFECGSRRQRRAGQIIALAGLLLVGVVVLGEATGVTDLSTALTRATTDDGRLQSESETGHVSAPAIENDPAGIGEAERIASAGPANRGTTEVFLVLNPAGAEQRFHTLGEAIAHSQPGATIEILNNGPFTTKGVIIDRALTIRAGAGFHPVIRQDLSGEAPNPPLILNKAPLVLEGITFERWPDPQTPMQGTNRWGVILHSESSGALAACNCRLFNVRGICLAAESDVVCRNCELFVPPGDPAAGRSGDGPAVRWSDTNEMRAELTNCILNRALEILLQSGDGFHLDLELTGNTFLNHGLDITLGTVPLEVLTERPGEPLVRAVARRNVWCEPKKILYVSHALRSAGNDSADEVDAAVRRLIAWREESNLYPHGSEPFAWYTSNRNAPARFVEHGLGSDLGSWLTFWQLTDTGSFNGKVRIVGGEVTAKLAGEPLLVTPEQFRLLSDSAGYRAAPDGKDLGADVDFVGPGEAYERWKQTPEYAKWLAETAGLLNRGTK